MDANEYILLCP